MSRVSGLARGAVLVALIGLGGCFEPYARARFLLPPSAAATDEQVRDALAVADSVASAHGLEYQTHPDTARYLVWRSLGTALFLHHDARTRVGFEVSQIGNDEWHGRGRELLDGLRRALESRHDVSCVDGMADDARSWPWEHEEVLVCWPRGPS